jgi:excisionase family DNA binding protein
MSERFLDHKETADLLGVCSKTIYRWIKNNEFPAYKVGKRWKFKVSDVEKWLKELNKLTKRK